MRLRFATVSPALAILVLTAFTFGCATATRQEERRHAIGPELSATQITEDAYVIRHEVPWPANSLLVRVRGTEWVMVDTPYTPVATERVLAWARSRFGEMKITAINTHFHEDRLGGNSALRGNGIPVFGSEETSRLAREVGLVPPDRVLGQTLALPGFSEEVLIEFPGPGHSLDNLTVYFPEKKILFAGCLVFSTPKPGNTKDANLKRWPESVNSLQAYRADWVIPGHGDDFSGATIENTIRALRDVRNTIAPAKKASRPI